jgi:hypothetical protein
MVTAEYIVASKPDAWRRIPLARKRDQLPMPEFETGNNNELENRAEKWTRFFAQPILSLRGKASK